MTAAAALGLVASCSSSPGCTLIGGESGVAVRFARPVTPQTVTVEACVAGTCTSRESPVLGDRVFVPNSEVSSEAAVDATVTVWGPDGHLLVPTTTATITPTKSQPNGPGCEPTLYAGTVTVTPRP
jgi:hypothetical protein